MGSYCTRLSRKFSHEEIMTKITPTGPTRQARAVKERSERGRVTGKLKTAIDRMVWFGDKRLDAATAAALSDHGVRTALRKPHVLAYLRSELALLREGERPRNLHRLAALRDQDDNCLLYTSDAADD